MAKKDEQAKAKAEDGQDNKAPEAPEDDTSKESVVTPAPEAEGEGEDASKNLDGQLKTVQGMLKQAQSRIKDYEKAKSDVEGLTVEVKGLREDLTLVTDILSNMAVDNEELQTKVAKSRQDREETQKRQAKATKTFGEIMELAAKAGLTAESPEMAPVRDAFVKGHQSGDYDQAKHLTFMTVIGKISEGKVVKVAEAEKPEETPKPAEKKKLPVNTSSAAPSQDWREKPSKNKIQDAIQKIREES